jgi:hypothetical protein
VREIQRGLLGLSERGGLNGVCVVAGNTPRAAGSVRVPLMSRREGRKHNASFAPTVSSEFMRLRNQRATTNREVPAARVRVPNLE